MSRASKITLTISTIFSIGTIGAVYFMAENEKDALQEGPVKDRARIEKRTLTGKQQANLNEYEEQKRLYAEMEKTQKLTGEIVHGIDNERVTK